MTLYDPTWIRDRVDYSFGDDSGLGIGSYLKPANGNNGEFMQIYQNCIDQGKTVMTLFCDNMRLYKRDCYEYTAVEKQRQDWRDIRDAKMRLYADQDVLRLCASLPDMGFIVFSCFEDTPIDTAIWDALPENVTVYASNCPMWGERVIPIPFGLQRKLAWNDDRLRVIQEEIDLIRTPVQLMYINFNPGNHPDRQTAINHYGQFHWATISYPGNGLVHDVVFRQYLNAMRDHKFVLCPSGNAEGCDCHRDIEALYMRRVPIVTDTPYHREIFTNFLHAPVLYVNNILDVTHQMLTDNDHLYYQMQTYDLSHLDIELIYNRILKTYEHGLQVIS